MSSGDLVQLYGGLGAMLIFIAGIVIGTLRAKTYFDNKFSEMRRFVRDKTERQDAAIRRLEYGAVLNWIGFQPGVDPPELRRADDDRDGKNRR